MGNEGNDSSELSVLTAEKVGIGRAKMRTREKYFETGRNVAVEFVTRSCGVQSLPVPAVSSNRIHSVRVKCSPIDYPRNAAVWKDFQPASTEIPDGDSFLAGNPVGDGPATTRSDPATRPTVPERSAGGPRIGPRSVPDRQPQRSRRSDPAPGDISAAVPAMFQTEIFRQKFPPSDSVSVSRSHENPVFPGNFAGFR